MTDRMDRVAKLITQELTMIIQKEIDDPKLRSITITKMDLTRDMRLAKIYYIPSVVDEEHKDEIRKGLKRIARFLRGALAHRMSMKFTPRLSFREDTTIEQQQKVDELFERIEGELRITPEEGTEEGTSYEE